MDHKYHEFPEVEVGGDLWEKVRDSAFGQLQDAGHEPKSADVFRDNRDLARSVTAGVAGLLAPQLEQVAKALDDPETGAACVVTPADLDGSPQTALLRTIVLMAVTDVPGNPLASDKLNHTPFTVYGASDDNKKAMEAAGLPNFAPGSVLGFHNDGGLAEDRIYVPERVGLQNVVLNYDRPGRFHWLPFAWWDEAEKLLTEYAGRTLTIGTTPIAHRAAGTGGVVVDRQVTLEVPALWRSAASGLPMVFLNGDAAEGSQGLFTDLQKSLARSRRRWVSAQAVHRITLIRNDRGVHARDVLEEPRAHGATHSRVMVRTISSRGEVVPRIDS